MYASLEESLFSSMACLLENRDQVVSKKIFNLEPIAPFTRRLYTSRPYRFKVGPVPMTVTGGLDGTLGIKACGVIPEIMG